MSEPPTTTRAWLRGRLVSAFPGQVVAAGWHSMVLETGEKDQRRLPLTTPCPSPAPPRHPPSRVPPTSSRS
ncbi:proteasome accessory factor PafA2 family protein [Actinomyces naeslundii]|uniref:proteasome accessory factor PafA2 family protein n=1 Tax=Actinomyces naeslundii TaxID=1655 RepID=UPI00209208AB|nr:proteasome accessory factor PafA2 family protein [Actinomyces naeslundii]